MNLLLRLLFLLTFIDCLIKAEQNYGENSVPENSFEEKWNFKRFLDIFGMGGSKPNPPHLQPRGPEYNNPYRYPCAFSTSTTTTPAPHPMLCPFPPYVPAGQGKPPYGEEFLPPHLPAPNSLDQLPPPPSSDLHLPPPPSSDSHLPHPSHQDGDDPIGSHSGPPPSFPGMLPQYPQQSGHPIPIFIPIQPGQNPPFPFPGQFNPGPYPGQGNPNQPPIQHFPNPIQPGQGPSGLPNFSAPPSLLPNDHPILPSLHHPERPVIMDPLNPQDPVKVNPVPLNPFDPIKVNPTFVNPNSPMQVNPVDIKPDQPVLIDPATIQPGQPLLVDPLNPSNTLNPPSTFNPPYSSVNYLPPPPALSDPKSFSKYPAISPFGPTNVLINPGFPEEPPPPPPQPSTTPPPPPPVNDPATQGQPEKPLPPFKPLDRPQYSNPGFPHPSPSLPPPPQGPTSQNLFLINPGIPPENIHLIPLLPPNGPPFGGQPPFPFVPPFNPPSNNLGNQTLPPPPSVANTSLPPPPDLYGNKPLGPPPSSDPIASPPSLEPAFVPPPPTTSTSSFPPPPPPFNGRPFMVRPEQPRPSCGVPFLKPYVPHGFYLSSVNQFIGMSPIPNQQLNFPCPTVDLLQTLDFNIMRDLIITSGLLPLFDHTKNYTLFLPSDAAFRRLPRWFRDSLDVDEKLKKALLLNHLIKEDLPLAVLENEELILSARPGGNRLRVNIYEPANTYRAITVDGAAIEKGDILSTNGRLHIVNKVIMPNLPRNAAEFLSEKLEFESFWNLVKQADLVQSFQDPRPFTLFIPINEAVQRLNDSVFLSDKDKLRNFISYHVVNGTYYSNGLINNEFLLTNYEKEIKLQVASDTFSKTLSGINGKVRVLKADITLTNGVAHVIDHCISEDTPFYVYPQSDEFKNEYGVLRRSFRVAGKEKNIENAFKR